MKETLYLIERNDVRSVVQIRMHGSGDNHQLFVVAFQLLESILAEVTGVGFLTMNEQYGTADFIAVCQDRCVEKCEIGSFVPAQTGVDGTGMIASLSLVVIVIIFHELRCIVGWLRIHHGTGISAGAIILRALGVKCLAHFVARIGIISFIEIAVCRGAADVVHRGSDRCLDACIVGGSIDGESSPTADAKNSDASGIHIGTCREVIHRSREIFRIDVGRSDAARLSATLTRKRGVWAYSPDDCSFTAPNGPLTAIAGNLPSVAVFGTYKSAASVMPKRLTKVTLLCVTVSLLGNVLSHSCVRVNSSIFLLL